MIEGFSGIGRHPSVTSIPTAGLGSLRLLPEIAPPEYKTAA